MKNVGSFKSGLFSAALLLAAGRAFAQFSTNSVTDGTGNNYGDMSGIAIDFDASAATRSITATPPGHDWVTNLVYGATYRFDRLVLYKGGTVAAAGPWYLGVYTGLQENLGVQAAATLTGFQGVSDNSIDLAAAALNVPLTWTFTNLAHTVIAEETPGSGNDLRYLIFQTGTNALTEVPSAGNARAMRRIDGTSGSFADELAAVIHGSRNNDPGSADVVVDRVPEYEAVLAFLAPPTNVQPPSVTGTSNSTPANLPELSWHLTARPWQPLNTSRTNILDKVEDIVNALTPLQYWNTGNPGDVQDGGDVQNGAIIDPFELKEWQYGTPYYSFAVATVVAAGRSTNLLEQGARALDHSTADIAGLDGSTAANDSHGEFFGAPMAKALRLFKQIAPQYPSILTPSRIARWESRMTVNRNLYMNGNANNWRTYGMKSEWLRVQDGLVPYDSDPIQGVPWIEYSWLTQGQRTRCVRDRDEFGLDPYFLVYHDNDPGGRQNFAYLAGATGNLLDMVYNGYDGPSAADLEEILRFGARSCMLLMAGNGEAPAGGRTGDHTWNDIVYGNLFEMAAEMAWTDGDAELAGRFRRAARLAFESAWRFQTEQGWFSVTKSQIHPSHQNGYASWSALVNYNGYTEIHSSEAFATRLSDIPEQPAPSEIGGYVAVLDPTFDSTFVNAGGMQVQICTEGSGSGTSSGSQRWFTPGIVRFSRPGWDSRLGPASAWIDNAGTTAISFSPAFYEGGVWKLLAEQPDRFAGVFTTTFTHPMLVRGTLTLTPKSGQTGPSFQLDMTITPDGVLVDTARASGTESYGIIWPILENDGNHLLRAETSPYIASTAFPKMSTNQTIIGAETASLSGGVTTSTAQADYNGSGYAVFPGGGGAIEWTGVEGGDGGESTIGFRYTLNQNTASSRTLTLRINGVAQSVTLEHTGKNSTYGGVLSFPMVWHQLYVPATLNSGTGNTIRLEAGTAGGLNIDELRVFPADAAQPEPDQQNFICLNASPSIDTSTTVRRTRYGDQRPVRVTNADNPVTTFVYPRSSGDPAAETVRTSFVRNGTNFTSVLGRVEGNLYVGRTSAGGEGLGIDLDDDGTNDVTFSTSCAFAMQLDSGAVTAIEADQFVVASYNGRQVKLAPFTPVEWSDTETMWNNIAVATAEQRFEVAVDFMPDSNTNELLAGFGGSGITDAADLIAAVRFGADGMVTPMLEAGLTDLPYVGGVSHRIRVLFDLVDGTYNLWVKPNGGLERRLVANAPLPVGVLLPSDLDTFAFFAPATAASSATTTAYPGPVDVKINFQAVSSEGYPDYLADTGEQFGDRGNGFSYGWIGSDISSLARNRNDIASPDERYDTLVNMQLNNPTTEEHDWEIALPNGTYTVKLVCGDPTYTDSFFHVHAEGITLLQGDAQGTGSNWFENSLPVTISDGGLTLTSGPGAYRNKVCFIEIAGGTDQFPYQHYGTWASDYFAGGLANPDAASSIDFDLDGLVNALEYAHGLNPTLAGQPWPYDVRVTNGGSLLEYSFRRSADALDVSYTLMEAGDLLGPWTPVWSSNDDAGFMAPGVIWPGTGGNDWVTIQLPIVPSAEQRYYRLDVNLY